MYQNFTQNQFDANKNKYSLKNVKISLPHLKDFPETSPNDIRPPSFKELSLPYRDIFTLHQEINTFFQNLKNNICKYYTKKQIFYLHGIARLFLIFLNERFILTLKILMTHFLEILCVLLKSIFYLISLFQLQQLEKFPIRCGHQCQYYITGKECSVCSFLPIK